MMSFSLKTIKEIMKLRGVLNIWKLYDIGNIYIFDSFRIIDKGYK